MVLAIADVLVAELVNNNKIFWSMYFLATSYENNRTAHIEFGSYSTRIRNSVTGKFRRQNLFFLYIDSIVNFFLAKTIYVCLFVNFFLAKTIYVCMCLFV